MTPTPTPFIQTYLQIFSSSDPVVQGLLSAVRGLAILVLALVLARYAKHLVVRLLTRSRVSLNLATLLGNLAQVGVVTVGVISALPSFGVDWASLLTLLGAIGLAVSLSMQDLLKNVIAGIYILIEQPFRIGDRITVKEATGQVQGIELRTTILWTDDNTQIVVPNAVIFTEILVNRSASELQRQTIVVGLKESNLSDISQEISRIVKSFEEVSSAPAPQIAIEEVKDGITRLRVQFWIRSAAKLPVTAQVVEALKAHFSDAFISVV